MSAKGIIYNEEARIALQNGINKVANAVGTTLGPRGKVVVLGRQFGGPMITKDGVTVAKDIELEDHFENLGAQLCKEVASKTNDVAGDGTTTATILASALVNEGMRFVAAGGNPAGVRKGIDTAVKRVVEYIKSKSKPVINQEDLIATATISGNDEEVGRTVTQAIDYVGKDGVVTIEESRGRDTIIETVDGLSFDRGYVSKNFVTNHEEQTCTLSNPMILITDKKLNAFSETLTFLEHALGAKRSFLIIADDFSNEYLTGLFINIMRGAIPPCCLVKSPGFGNKKQDILEDIAVSVGATVISTSVGMSLSDLTAGDYATSGIIGEANKVIVEENSTIILSDNADSEKVKDRISVLKTMLSKAESDYDKKQIEERLSRITGGVAVIYIGADTETELKEKKHRYEDALAASKAALEGGTVCGGGTIFLRAAIDLQSITSDDIDVKYGIQMVQKALEAPTRTIASNAGVSPDIVINNVLSNASDHDYGYNAATSEYGNMYDHGVIDPAKVSINAILNASSIASLVLTTECLVNDLPQKNNPMMPHPEI